MRQIINVITGGGVAQPLGKDERPRERAIRMVCLVPSFGVAFLGIEGMIYLCWTVALDFGAKQYCAASCLGIAALAAGQGLIPLLNFVSRDLPDLLTTRLLSDD
jgi:hypothetical protein